MNTAMNLSNRLGLALDHCVDEVLAQTWLLDLLAASAAWPAPGDAAPAPPASRARPPRRAMANPVSPAVPTLTRQEKLPC